MAASTVELEEMVVKIGADMSKYLTDLNRVSHETRNVADKVEHEANRIEGFKHSVEGFAEGIAKSLGAIGIGVEIFHSFEKFEEAEKNMRRLEAAVESNGGEVEKVVHDYKDFAARMTEVTASSKKEILSILQKVETYGLSGEAAKKAAQDTLYLASATGHNAEELAMAVTMYEKGNVHMLKRMLHLHGITDELQLQERIQKLVSVGQKTAAAEAESASARIEKAQQKLGAVAKEVGAIAAKFIMPVVEMIGRAAESFNKMDKETRKWLVTGLAAVGTLAILPATISRIQWALGGLAIAYNTVATSAGRAAAAQKLQSSMRTGVALPIALAAGITYGINEATGMNKAFSEANTQLEKTVDQFKKISEWQSEIANNANKKIESTTDSVTKQKLMTNEVERTNKEWEEAKKRVEAFKTEQDKMVGSTAKQFWSAFGQKVSQGLQAVGIRDDPLQQYIKQAQEAEVAAGKLAAAAKAAQEKMLGKPIATEETNQKVRDLIKATKEEIIVEGLDADAKKVSEFMSKNVASALTDELSASLHLLTAKKEAIELAREEAKILDDRIKSRSDFIKSLTKEREEYGKTAEELKILKSIELGFDKDKDLFGKTKDLIHNNELLKESIDLTKKYKSPVQELYEEFDKLNEIFSKGLIDNNTYGNALDDAKKKFDDASKAAMGTKQEIQKLNGVLGGTAESKFVISSFLDSNKQSAITPGENKIAGILTDIRGILSKGQTEGTVHYKGEYGGGGDFGDADLGGI